MQQAVLRLFNAILIDNLDSSSIPREIIERTIRNGYVLESGIKPDKQLLDTIESVIGISGDKANAAFHKSWQIVQEASNETLVLQQMLHYITTYGFEAEGFYHQDTVFIPQEALNIPVLKQGIPLVLIKAISKDALLDEIVSLSSGVALSKETINDILTIVEANKFESGFVDQIGNRELKAALYDYYGIIPEEPVEFLRHLISKLTNETLLIKNDHLIEKIKKSNGKFLDLLLDKAPPNLGSIFYRYKPIFMALKSISNNKTFFNRLRKQAPKLHQPLKGDFLNDVTSQIKRGVLCPDKLQEALEKANIFRKIRLAYALNYRLNTSNSIVYRVRNGRGWATEFDWPDQYIGATKNALDIVINSMVADFRPNLEGMKIFIPPYMQYTLPATEKQFTGNFPSGSSITAQDDLIVGIHWLNTKRRIDLDLSVIGESGKIGWDASYRSKELNVLFSGDVTDAPPPHGATELFYLKGGFEEAKILMLNYFNYSADDEVEAKIIIANEKPKNFGQNYVVDPNNIVATANINITQKQSILGLISPNKKGGKVFLSHVSVGTSISSSQNVHSTYARNYLIQSLLRSIDLKSILISAGAIITERKVGDEDFDLSPEALNKATIINLMKKV